MVLQIKKFAKLKEARKKLADLRLKPATAGMKRG